MTQHPARVSRAGCFYKLNSARTDKIFNGAEPLSGRTNEGKVFLNTLLEILRGCNHERQISPSIGNKLLPKYVST